MFSKRNAVLLCLGLCALIALRASSDFLPRLRARHVKQTILVSAGNRRLAGFFDGLAPAASFRGRQAGPAKGVLTITTQPAANNTAQEATMTVRRVVPVMAVQTSAVPMYAKSPVAASRMAERAKTIATAVQ